MTEGGSDVTLFCHHAVCRWGRMIAHTKRCKANKGVPVVKMAPARKEPRFDAGSLERLRTEHG